MWTIKHSAVFHFIFYFLILISVTILYPSVCSADSKIDTAENYRLQGYDAQKKGDIKAALKFYSMALGLGLENSVLYNDVAILYEQFGEPFRAERLYRKAIALDKDYLPSYMNLAYLYLKEGETAKAIFFFKLRYEKGDPNNQWTQKAHEELIRLDPQFHEQMLQEQAQQLQQELIEQSQQEFEQRINQAKAHHRAGQQAFERGEYVTAADEYDQALTLLPQHPDVLRDMQNLENTLLKKKLKDRYENLVQKIDAGESETVQHMLNSEQVFQGSAQDIRSHRLQKHDFMTIETQSLKVERALRLFETGQALFQAKQWQEALEHFLQAQKDLPHHHEIRRYIQDSRMELSKKNMTVHFQQALDMINRGDSLMAQQEIRKMMTSLEWEQVDHSDPLQAVRDLSDEMAFNRRRQQSEDLFNQAEIFRKQGLLDEAIKAYDLALENNPANLKIKEARDAVKLELAKTQIRYLSDQALELVEQGRVEEAQKEIQNMLKTFPSN